MQGCTKGQLAEFINGTGTIIIITTDKGEVKIQQGGRGLISIADLGKQFTLEASGRKSQYAFQISGSDYAVQTRMKTIFRFLIDSNYVIYALSPSDDPSQGRPATQPAGLPLRPKDG